MEGLASLIIIIYLICHSPAIIMLIVGFVKLKKRPILAKKLFIAAGVYFVIGAGICGAMLT